MQVIEYLSPLFGLAGTLWAGLLLLTVAILLLLPQMRVIVRVRNRPWLSAALACLGLYFIALAITSSTTLQPYVTTQRVMIAFTIRFFLIVGFCLNFTLWLAHSIRKQVVLE